MTKAQWIERTMAPIKLKSVIAAERYGRSAPAAQFLGMVPQCGESRCGVDLGFDLGEESQYQKVVVAAHEYWKSLRGAYEAERNARAGGPAAKLHAEVAEMHREDALCRLDDLWSCDRAAARAELREMRK